MSNAENPFDPLGRNPYQSPGPAPVGQPDLGPPRQQSVMAIISLVTGILSIASSLLGCCCFLFSGGGSVIGFISIVLGYMGMQECKEQGKSGKELALAGLICGIVGVVLGILMVVLSFLGILVQAGAGAANQLNQPNF